MKTEEIQLRETIWYWKNRLEELERAVEDCNDPFERSGIQAEINLAKARIQVIEYPKESDK